MGRVTVAGGKVGMEVPSAGIALADIAEGSIVKLNENGAPVEFYVAKHDYESSLNGVGRTLLMRKDCHSNQAWGSRSTASYSASSLNTWLNGTYKGLLDSKCQEAMATTKIRVCASRINTKITTISCDVFVLAASEVTDISSDGVYCPVETTGGKLSTSSVWRSAYYQGTLTAWWTRTVHTNTNDTMAICIMDKDQSWGATNGQTSSVALGVRPCFTLPATALFDEETLEFKGVA